MYTIASFIVSAWFGKMALTHVAPSIPKDNHPSKDRDFSLCIFHPNTKDDSTNLAKPHCRPTAQLPRTRITTFLSRTPLFMRSKENKLSAGG